MTNLPHWTEDPHIDQAAHQLLTDRVETASAVAGRDLWSGSCTCGEMAPTPPWDDYAVDDAHELHMQLMQIAARRGHSAATRVRSGGEQQ
ncbi:hypothetical protein [Nocardia niwae]|uniref:hypothetical protein n=1 Tax=Nocardia niwae TaxID=626084 RepID=UPI0033DFBCD0